MHHGIWISRTIISSFLFLSWWCLSQFGVIMSIRALIPVSAITMLHIVPTLFCFILGINLWGLPGLQLWLNLLLNLLLVVHRILYIVIVHHIYWLVHSYRHVSLHFRHVLLRVHKLLLGLILLSLIIFHSVFILKVRITLLTLNSTIKVCGRAILVAILLVNKFLGIPHVLWFDRVVRLS